MSLVGGGGQAELAVIYERESMVAAANLDCAEAGTFWSAACKFSAQSST
jgi:hypothetical protein